MKVKVTGEESVIKKRGYREMIGSVMCENVGSNILRKATILVCHVSLYNIISLNSF